MSPVNKESGLAHDDNTNVPDDEPTQDDSTAATTTTTHATPTVALGKSVERTEIDINTAE
jgi:hypothetical protein